MHEVIGWGFTAGDGLTKAEGQCEDCQHMLQCLTVRFCSCYPIGLHVLRERLLLSCKININKGNKTTFETQTHKYYCHTCTITNNANTPVLPRRLFLRIWRVLLKRSLLLSAFFFLSCVLSSMCFVSGCNPSSPVRGSPLLLITAHCVAGRVFPSI